MFFPSASSPDLRDKKSWRDPSASQGLAQGGLPRDFHMASTLPSPDAGLLRDLTLPLIVVWVSPSPLILVPIRALPLLVFSRPRLASERRPDTAVPQC